MIDLQQWRVSVGAFHAVQSSSSPPRKGNCQASLARDRPVRLSISILLLALLLLAGDVEANPGPPKITRGQAAQVVFKDFFPRISKSIQCFLDRFAGELLRKDLIDSGLVSDLAHGPLGVPLSKQANKVLCAVQDKIDSAKSDKPFRSLCHVMEEFPVLNDLTSEMTEKFDFLCSNDSALSDRSSSDDDSTTLRQVPNSTSSSATADTCTLRSIPVVKKYISFLKENYTSSTFATYSKRPHISFHSKKFINVVLVHKERVADEKQRDELHHARLHGDADKVRGKKTPLRMEEIGKFEEGSPHRHVLIEGDPGIGKTSFVWELCRQWSHENALKRWPLVVLVQLCHKRVRQANSLSDLLYHPDASISKAVCKEMRSRSGKGLLLIFDGFDDLSEKQRSESSIFQQIISEELLPQATLMITSRPIARRDLDISFLEQVEQHVKILGFTKSNIDEYVSSACDDNESLHKDFKGFIRDHPFVYLVMYIPLLCSIVTDLYRTYWKEGETGFAPSTKIELYTAIVQMLLSRYLHGHTDYGPQRMKLKDFIDLPEKVQHQLRSIAQLAATSIEEKQYVFDSVPGGGDTLGLMVEVEDVYVPLDQGRSVSYSFLHITIQEYLAEFDLSQLVPPQREDIIMQPSLPCRLMTSNTLECRHLENSVQETDDLQTVTQQVQVHVKGTETQPVQKLIQSNEDELQIVEMTVQVKDPQLSQLQDQLQTVNLVLQAKDYELHAMQELIKGSERESYDLKQTIKSLESKTMELEEHVQQLDKVSSEKDTIIEKYMIENEEVRVLELNNSRQQLANAKSQLEEEERTKVELQQKLTGIQNEEAQLKVSLQEKEDELKTLKKISRAQGVEVHKLLSEMQTLKDTMKRKEAEPQLPLKQKRGKVQTGTQDKSFQADYLALTSDSMLAAEVLAETVLEVTGDGHQSLSWSGHGFRLTVPAGAVPMDSTISLAVKCILTGEFDLPNDCQLLSAIFWIKASQLFNRDVTLHLHHCGMIESEAQCSQYKFVAGRCSQPDLPYKLVLREGGVFNPHSQEASISVKQFSFYAIVHVGAKKDSRPSYIGQVFFRPYKGEYVWQVDFAVTRDIPPLPDLVQEKYERGGWNFHHEQQLEFEEPTDNSSPAITLHFNEESSSDDKWEVDSLGPAKIMKDKVDKTSEKSHPPRCRLSISWTGRSRRRFPTISHRVNLEGARRPYHYFTIKLPETERSSSLREARPSGLLAQYS